MPDARSNFALRYELGRLLGRGGMGEVFEAVARGDYGFERRVAVKRLFADAFEQADRDEFFEEARIASRIHHGGIVSILDYGVVDGRPFQVLELVEGVTAGAAATLGRAAGSPMPVGIALHIVTEAAHALHAAHTARDATGALGIVHRDVKPTNILVSFGGDVKVSDFGIAKARGRRLVTTGEATKGTRGFMAPEQSMRGNVDARSDVFALGATLHALVTGRSPLASHEAERRVLLGEEPTLDDTLPDDVREIVRKAMRRSPDQRFESAAELARASGKALAPRLRGDAKSELLGWLTPLVSRDGAGPGPALSKRSTVATTIRMSGKGEPRVFTTRAPAPAEAAPRSGRTLFILGLGLTLTVGSVAAFLLLVSNDAIRTATSTASSTSARAPVAPPADAAASDADSSARLVVAVGAPIDATTTATSEVRGARAPNGHPQASGSSSPAGDCVCRVEGMSRSLCPFERSTPRRTGCGCMSRAGSMLFHLETGWSLAFESASGFGGEPCRGRNGAIEEDGAVYCDLCGWRRVYHGSTGAPCRGLSGMGRDERTGSLECP